MLGAAVAIGCTYETLAIVTGRAPTITRIVHRHRNTPGGLIMTVAGLWWLTWHLLIETPQGVLNHDRP